MSLLVNDDRELGTQVCTVTVVATTTVVVGVVVVRARGRQFGSSNMGKGIGLTKCDVVGCKKEIVTARGEHSPAAVPLLA